MRTTARHYASIRENIEAAYSVSATLEKQEDQETVLLKIGSSCLDIADHAELSLLVLEVMKKKMEAYKKSIEQYLEEQKEDK